MRWFVILGVLVGGYYYFLTHTADMVLAQVEQLHGQYTYVEKHADQLAGAPGN